MKLNFTRFIVVVHLLCHSYPVVVAGFGWTLGMETSPSLWGSFVAWE